MVYQVFDICQALSQAYGEFTNQPNFRVKNRFVRNGRETYAVNHISGRDLVTGDPELAVRDLRAFWNPRTNQSQRRKNLFYLAQRAKSGKLMTACFIRLVEHSRASGHPVLFEENAVTSVDAVEVTYPRFDYPELEYDEEAVMPMFEPYESDRAAVLNFGERDPLCVDLTAHQFGVYSYVEDIPLHFPDLSQTVPAEEDFMETLYDEDDDPIINYEEMLANIVERAKTLLSELSKKRKAAKKRARQKQRRR